MPARLSPAGGKPNTPRIEGQGRLWGSRPSLVVFGEPFPAFEDSGAGTVTLVGSGTDSHSFTDSQAGTITVSGSVPSESNVHAAETDYQDVSTIEFVVAGARSESSVHSGSGSGTIRLGFERGKAYPGAFYPGQVSPGQNTERHIDLFVAADSRAGTVTATGESSRSSEATHATSGTVTVTGTRAESLLYTDTATGTLVVSGTASEEYEEGDRTEYNDARTGTIAVAGTFARTSVHTATGAGTVTLSGSGSAPPPFDGLLLTPITVDDLGAVAGATVEGLTLTPQPAGSVSAAGAPAPGTLTLTPA